MFDKGSGAMKTGCQWIADQKKTVYYNSRGEMQYGRRFINGRWYNFNKTTGALMK